jgi:hypothetical protein
MDPPSTHETCVSLWWPRSTFVTYVKGNSALTSSSIDNTLLSHIADDTPPTSRLHATAKAIGAPRVPRCTQTQATPDRGAHPPRAPGHVRSEQENSLLTVRSSCSTIPDLIPDCQVFFHQSRASSTSTYVQRISAEQAAVEARLFEINGMETIQTGMRNANIRGEEDMNVDPPFEPPVSRAIEAKRKALSQYVRTPLCFVFSSLPHSISSQGAGCANGSSHLEAMTYQEAIELQQRAYARDLERQQQIEEKKKRMGLPRKGELLTRQEREARIWAFM